jgi:integrase
MKFRTPEGWFQKMLPPEIQVERDAHTWAKTFLSTSSASTFAKKPGPPASGPTVAQLEERWLAFKKQRVSTPRAESRRLAPATYKNYESHFKIHIRPLLGDKRPHELSIPVLRRFVRDLSDRMSPNTCWNVVSTLSKFLDDCKFEGWVAPFENLSKSDPVLEEMPERASTPVVALPVSTAQELVDCPDIPFMRRAKYTVLFTTGLTDGEAAGLHWEDAELDADIPVVRVRRAVPLIGPNGHATPGLTKNKWRLRTLPLHSAAVQALRIWRDEGWRLWARRSPQPGSPIFPNVEGGYVRSDAADQLRGDLEAIGKPKTVDGLNITIHATRRSFATWLDELGTLDRDRKHLMGHAVHDVTDKHYTVKNLPRWRAQVELIPLVWSSTLVPVLGSQEKSPQEPSSADSSMDTAPQWRLKYELCVPLRI